MRAIRPSGPRACPRFDNVLNDAHKSKRQSRVVGGEILSEIPIQHQKTARMNVADETKAHVVPDVIRIDQEQVRSHVDEVVRSTVEETLNGLLEQEISIGTSKPATQRHQSP